MAGSSSANRTRPGSAPESALESESDSSWQMNNRIEAPVLIRSPCSIACCLIGTSLTKVPLKLPRSCRLNTSPSLVMRQCCRDNSGSAMQIELDGPRPMLTSASVMEKTAPSKGPDMEMSLGIIGLWRPVNVKPQP